ncbi:hypothetical protein C10C_0812 [Chlamydia serpentis]|uniref:Uncharacterized protein n=1 Tax=Chlamydia serpentis TaxID=1967782 RepID=A0A2R8FBZ2_9CHLA|nr:pyocin knob domain-containing protein [Chlamydia serpentis]SPN73955.1 hypothetical protein C10C_0812 [Chlamydia serpentis]
MNYDQYDTPDPHQDQIFENLLCNSEEAISLDKYQETGVYVEENADQGDLLIVLGESVFKDTIHQFYLNDDNYAYTRYYIKNAWKPWSNIPLTTISEHSYDCDNLLGTQSLLTTNVNTLLNAPAEFLLNTENHNHILLSIASHTTDHYVQFLIAHNRRQFWIRYYNDETWSEWTQFI